MEGLFSNHTSIVEALIGAMLFFNSMIFFFMDKKKKKRRRDSFGLLTFVVYSILALVFSASSAVKAYLAVLVFSAILIRFLVFKRERSTGHNTQGH